MTAISTLAGIVSLTDNGQVFHQGLWQCTPSLISALQVFLSILEAAESAAHVAGVVLPTAIQSHRLRFPPVKAISVNLSGDVLFVVTANGDVAQVYAVCFMCYCSASAWLVRLLKVLMNAMNRR